MFLNRLDRFSKGQEFPFTICLRDPLGNSFISAPLGSSLPPEMDSNLTIVDYTRSFEEVTLWRNGLRLCDLCDTINGF